MALCQQGLGRLRQLRIEQFVDFVIGVDVAPKKGGGPADADADHQGYQQPPAEGKPDRAGHGRVTV